MARRVLIVGAHVLLYAASFVGAFLLRFDFDLSGARLTTLYTGGAIAILARTVSGFPFGIYSGVLKYASIKDLIDIFKAMTVASVVFVVVMVLVGLRGFPRSVIAIDWLASIMLVGGLRFGLRLARETLTGASDQGVGARKRVLILGAGDAGEALARDLQRMYRDRYRVVGFLDDNSAKRGLRIHDVPVMGPLMALGDSVPRYQIDEVIIAIPTASAETMRRIVDIAKIAGVPFKTIPGVGQLIDGTVTVNQIRDVAIEDLLGRDPVALEEGLLRRFLHAEIVMVSGAGGSIGSELCRQICRYRPRQLVLFEQSEPYLFFIHQELIRDFPDIDVVPVIGDVTDVARVERVYSLHGPTIIFHAAAHKHVPMMEWNPGEAIKNNVFGTKVMSDMANLFGAKAFVMVSTDKAVNPTSVMGASKRVSEMYVQSLSADSSTLFSAVRFGNVLGSVGSVVPTFKDQIAAGGPVTVTHPDMRRYFMTIPESCQLVMQAAAMGEGGEIFALDMGEPIKIIDLARDLISLSGFEPDKDIEIAFTGLRPGEKLFEELGFDAEKMSKTRHPKVFIGKLTPHSNESVLKRVEFLLSLANDTRTEVIKAGLKAVVPEYETEVAPLQVDFQERNTIEMDMSSVVPEPVAASSVPRSQADDVAPAEEKQPLSEREIGEVEEVASSEVQAEVPVRPSAQIDGDSADGGRSGGTGSDVNDEHAETSAQGLVDDSGEASSEKPLVERVAAIEGAEAFCEGNPLLDPLWDALQGVCREHGFLGVAWSTMGVRPADVREAMFEGGLPAAHGVLRRSLPISSLAFVEVRFFYPGPVGKRTPEQIKHAVRTVATEMTKEMFSLSRAIHSAVPSA